jgi:hypothetical protein
LVLVIVLLVLIGDRGKYTTIANNICKTRIVERLIITSIGKIFVLSYPEFHPTGVAGNCLDDSRRQSADDIMLCFKRLGGKTKTIVAVMCSGLQVESVQLSDRVSAEAKVKLLCSFLSSSGVAMVKVMCSGAQVLRKMPSHRLIQIASAAQSWSDRHREFATWSGETCCSAEACLSISKHEHQDSEFNVTEYPDHTTMRQYVLLVS